MISKIISIVYLTFFIPSIHSSLIRNSEKLPSQLLQEILSTQPAYIEKTTFQEKKKILDPDQNFNLIFDKFYCQDFCTQDQVDEILLTDKSLFNDDFWKDYFQQSTEEILENLIKVSDFYNQHEYKLTIESIENLAQNSEATEGEVEGETETNTSTPSDNDAENVSKPEANPDSETGSKSKKAVEIAKLKTPKTSPVTTTKHPHATDKIKISSTNSTNLLNGILYTKGYFMCQKEKINKYQLASGEYENSKILQSTSTLYEYKSWSEIKTFKILDLCDGTRFPMKNCEDVRIYSEDAYNFCKFMQDEELKHMLDQQNVDGGVPESIVLHKEKPVNYMLPTHNEETEQNAEVSDSNEINLDSILQVLDTTEKEITDPNDTEYEDYPIGTLAEYTDADNTFYEPVPYKVEVLNDQPMADEKAKSTVLEIPKSPLGAEVLDLEEISEENTNILIAESNPLEHLKSRRKTYDEVADADQADGYDQNNETEDDDADDENENDLISSESEDYDTSELQKQAIADIQKSRKQSKIHKLKAEYQEKIRQLEEKLKTQRKKAEEKMNRFKLKCKKINNKLRRQKKIKQRTLSNCVDEVIKRKQCSGEEINSFEDEMQHMSLISEIMYHESEISMNNNEDYKNYA